MLRSSGSSHAVLSYLCPTKERRPSGRELCIGLPPDHGTVLDVPLITGRTVKARIGRFRRESGMKKGTGVRLVTELYADEI
jgi:hypothetical protein